MPQRTPIRVRQLIGCRYQQQESAREAIQEAIAGYPIPVWVETEKRIRLVRGLRFFPCAIG
jgi:hypothetical protein